MIAKQPAATRSALIVPLGQHDHVEFSSIRAPRWITLLQHLSLSVPEHSADDQSDIVYKAIESHLSLSVDLQRVIEVIHTLGNDRGRDIFTEISERLKLDVMENFPIGDNPIDETHQEFALRIWLLAQLNENASEVIEEALIRIEVRPDHFCRCYRAKEERPVVWTPAHAEAIKDALRGHLQEQRVTPFVECAALVSRT